MTPSKFFAASLILMLPILTCSSGNLSQTTLIVLDPSTTYQTMIGWEATDFIGQVHPLADKWMSKVADLAANDLGINQIRLEVLCGSENDRDYFADRRAGRIDETQFNCFNSSTVNDNNDPFTINEAGFHFSKLDLAVESVVLPMKERLAAKGERLGVNLCYVAFTNHRLLPECPAGLQYHHLNPEEYAEFILATALHLRGKYNLVPDFWEVILEADNVPGWGGQQIGRAIVAAGNRLKANGFDSPRFIAPSTTNMSNAPVFFEAMVQVPGVLPYLSTLSYHRYGGVSNSALQTIASKASQYGIQTAMLEHIGSGYENLHEDLTIGMNSIWQQFTIAGPDPGDDGGRYYLVNISDPNNPFVTLASRTRFLRQYFKFIRSGAVRIKATAEGNGMNPVAFINRDGKYVVVVKANEAGSLLIQGLPPGTYGIKYTTANQYDIDQPDATVSTGQTLSASIPQPGVITIYAKASETADNRAVINRCSLEPNITGTYILTVFGANIRAGASVTVGGIAPKKIKYKSETSAGQGIFSRLVLKGKLCSGLPGEVIITNSNAPPSVPFRCDSRCQ
jgi:hypothetical protein